MLLPGELGLSMEESLGLVYCMKSTSKDHRLSHQQHRLYNEQGSWLSHQSIRILPRGNVFSYWLVGSPENLHFLPVGSINYNSSSNYAWWKVLVAHWSHCNTFDCFQDSLLTRILPVCTVEKTVFLDYLQSRLYCFCRRQQSPCTVCDATRMGRQATGGHMIPSSWDVQCLTHSLALSSPASFVDSDMHCSGAV